MMISSSYIFSNYLFSLLLFLNFNNPIFFWILMEFNLVSFILVLYMDKSSKMKQDSMNFLIFYFLIQSSSSILFLSNYSLSEWGSIFNYDTMFILSLIFKIGLFPFFFWIFSLSDSINFLSLIILLSLQKVPLFLGLYFSNTIFVLWLFFFSFICGSIMLFLSKSLIDIFICSSISYSYMLFILYVLDLKSFFMFFSIYSIFLFFCLNSYKKFSDFNLDSILILSYFFFLGLPPLGLFFYKFIFSFLILCLGNVEMLTFWIFSFVSLLGYMKFFYSSFFLFSPLYLKKFFYNKMMSFFFFLLTFFIFFAA